MIINRNNYENFFLLYVDGELCAAEKKMLEDFIAVNPDLKEELDLLKQTIIPADEILFFSKKNLYKATLIDIALQEKLLLKIDNELSLNEMVFITEAIAKNEDVNATYQLLQSVKLDATENIIFKNKEVLYKNETGKIVIGQFGRWAAAAVLIGFGLFYTITLFNKKDNNEIAVTDKINPKNKINKIAVPNTDIQTSIQDTLFTNKNNTVVKDNNVPTKITGENSIAVKENKKEKNTVTNKNDAALNKQPQNIQTLRVKKEDIILPAIKIINEEQKQQIAAVALPKKIKDPASDNNIVPLENTYAMASSLNYAADKNDNKILYMDEDAVKRSKTGGFFRKIKRVIERTAKIKTGNSLKIAGFEFAAK